MSKTEANPITENNAEGTPSEPKETLKLKPVESGEGDGKESPPANTPLFDTKNMSEEEKEQKAKEWGYIPATDFRGDKSRHMNAEEYLEASQRKLPAMQHQIKKQDAIIDNLRSMNQGLNDDLERQKIDLSQQMKEASEDNDMFRFRNLEKQEKNLEERQETLQTNINSLEQEQTQDDAKVRQEEVVTDVGKWIQKNKWFSNPETSADFAKKGFADLKFNEYTAKYPDARASQIMHQIDADMTQFTQQSGGAYNYNGGGANTPMGQPAAQDKTEANLTDGGKKMLRNVQNIARSPEESTRLTKHFLSSSTNNELFKWHKN